VTSRAEKYRQVARDFDFMARDLTPGENRSMLLKMAEECDRLADQQEQPLICGRKGQSAPQARNPLS
jgi:hypothetical protein